jgi:hypothetical protein
MKIFLRKKDIQSYQELYASGIWDTDSAYDMYCLTERISSKMYIGALSLVVIGLGSFVAFPISNSFWFFVLGWVCNFAARAMFNFSRNYNFQSKHFRSLCISLGEQEFPVHYIDYEELEEAVLNEIHYYDDYFDKPSWLYGKPAEPKSQFEIET